MANNMTDEEQWIEKDETEIEKQIDGEAVREPDRTRSVTRKKKRKKRRNSRKWLVIPVLLAVLVIVALTVFRVHDLQIEGNHRVGEDEVKEVIQWDSCQGNTLLLLLLNRKVDVSSNELLANINVSMINPWTVKVDVEEQSLVASVLIGEQYFYMNDSGLIILNQAERMSEIPVLEGLEVEKAEAGSILKTGNDAVLDDMLDIAECLLDFEIAAESVEQAEEGGYMIQMNKIKVLLGPDLYMEEKVSELKDLIPELDSMSGTLHLENYDSTKDSIIFTKDS